jgi:N-terminal EH-domain containing protein
MSEEEVTAVDDRSAAISARLKQIYQKSILPVEKKYRYDYFFESPLLSDVEFDGTCNKKQKHDNDFAP